MTVTVTATPPAAPSWDQCTPRWLVDILDNELGAGAVGMRAIKRNVARVWLDDGASVIVKQSRAKLPNQATVNGWSPEFVAEDATYEFLDAVGFEFTARCLARRPGLLVLEDLGTCRGEADSNRAAAVMATLAELHLATAGRDAERETCLLRAGWTTDERMYSEEQYSRLLAVGTDVIASVAVNAAPTRAFVDAARQQLAASSMSPALLHDDVLVARQFAMRDGRCHLLDWEMAKFGHPALDVARTLVGKLDRLAGTHTYAARHLGFERSVTDVHRDLLRADANTWADELDAAIVLRSVANLGAQHCVVGAEAAAGGHDATRDDIVDRMLAMLTQPRATELTALLRRS